MLNQLHKSVWETNLPLRVMGVEIGHRMTVVKLASGSLWVHSPVQCEDDIRLSLGVLGPVAHVICPSRIHDLYLQDYFRHYPQARFWGSPGLERDHPAWHITDLLGRRPPMEWQDEIDQHAVAGIPRISEFVFYHRASGSLIVADLVFNTGWSRGFVSNLILWLNGAYRKVSPSKYFRSHVRDRAALLKSIDTILQWDFERIIVGHGRIVESGARKALRDAYSWLS